ncbi:hypothetical protein BY996DRAFT_6423816 [Phakopsora pachyrhizi]|nr:hypothetical protein BY996DRAFT_6423816 [Phakopsora pachyrhizi]
MDSKYFKQITQGGATGDILWKCLLCNSRATTNIRKHSLTDIHKAQVREVEKRNAINDIKSTSDSENDDMENYLQENNLDIEDQDKNSESFGYDSANDLDSDLSDTYSSSSEGGESNEDILPEKDDIYGNERTDSTWFPFKKKEELGNPLVSNYLDFYPEDAQGKNLKEILADNLCKPYNEIRVDGGESLASKCKNALQEKLPEKTEVIQLPNHWRVKAQGKMIRHVPLNFYADDTSGNLSKQWNKHISIFMSLAGLPPHFSNLEFNTLFFGTSNIASALELFTPVNEELNKLSTTEFSAFDFSIQEDVLVLPVVLLFMAESPMHAEITSTMSPNISLQPCRICNLKADKKKEKKTAVYVEKFLGHNLNGFLFQTELRSWTATKDNIYYTWEMIQRGAPKLKSRKALQN